MRTGELSRTDRMRVKVLRTLLSDLSGMPEDRVHVVRSPYRVCPLGAHVDHQMGEVTGMALDRALLLGFVPEARGNVVIRSFGFPGVARFALSDIPQQPLGDWADYARGAALALSRRHPLLQGVTACVDGHPDVEGLSSSAAVGVAYLLALEAANGLDLAPEDNIELDRVVENEYIGVSNGILDQSVILLSRPGHLIHLDCLSGASHLVPFGGEQEASIVVLFSGLRRRLTDTDYNRRVAECSEAAGLLLEAAGAAAPASPHLRDASHDVFVRHRGRLPDRLRRRAEHFFSEQDRVRRGVELWRAGDLAGFGRLMSESGWSSVENYDCGNPYLRDAYEILRDCPGVYGARFSGAGFRGCCIGLAEPGCEDTIAQAALSQYLAAHPDMAGQAKVRFCRSAEGAAILS